MAYVDTTFERGGDVVKTVAKAFAGWTASAGGGRFYGEERVPYRGDVTIRSAVWLSEAFSLDPVMASLSFGDSIEFPRDFTSQFDNGILRASVARGEVSIVIELNQMLPWIVTSNGKPAVDAGYFQIAQHQKSVYLLRHMLVFNLPTSRAGDYREWDLLPFLPGGLVERNRRRH
jgi:hypothetical protein